ncbi:4-amino-4-deoxy-L-arabinose transferase-like glycosyltransferase [Curtobacterium luteum]|uniref:4-amino-4-deoxy-L-arabinose transferase-like glycosyltransferase n=1 Tax=Curtobacterium luteum TaxID=33881 RepID=A0A8H9L1K5_9MICO|nr:DUF2142 domain-containing protein [Curtobacterium luteum]MBM7802079.1 4-amino-4-deoxy-L-arabinose transferase-like glycosyltransferase [Curtobacterium luteum]NUU51353.1 DUF2142 domain-containing protein [Curtobacterium luteum]GGL09270.1 hypothetical protein GCM10009769_29140 [Curtobacterium luteum]
MTTEPQPPVVARWERVAIAVVTATFGLWLVAWALLVPVFEAPDETAHIDATVHVALGDAWAAPGDLRVTRAVLIAKQQQATQPSDEWATVTELLQTFPGPSTTVNQMTQHPPTAYLVGAAVLRAVHYGDLRWDHAFLALRLADVAMVTALPLLAWSAVRRVTRSPRAALVGGLAVFASPELASIGSSVSNDAPVLLLAGVTVWLATRMLTGDLRWRTAIGLAVALGALVWVKGTGLPAVPFVGVVVLFSGVGLLGWGARALRTVVVLGVSGAIGAWWWLHNLVAYGRVQPNGYTAMRPPKDFPPGEHPTLGHFLDVSWGTLTRTFWGSFGGRAQVTIGDLLTAVITLVALVVLLGWAFRRGPELRTLTCLAVFPALLIAIQNRTSAHSYLTTTEVAATQGRYYFPAIVCLIVLSAVAWRRLLPSGRFRGVAVTGLAVVLPAIGVYGFAVAAAWFWNAAVFPVTGRGLLRYSEVGPVPPVVLAVVVVLVGVGLVASVVQVVRAGARQPEPVPASTGA